MSADTPFTYWFLVDHVYDGDSIMGSLDMGLAHYLGRNPSPTYTVRMFGINAPEMNAKDPAVRAAAVAARDYLRTLILPGDYIQITSYGWDKFGMRLDAVPFTTSGEDACMAMLTSGNAVPYNP